MFHVIPILLLSTGYLPSLAFGFPVWEHLMSKHFLWIDVFYYFAYNRPCALCFERLYLVSISIKCGVFLSFTLSFDRYTLTRRGQLAFARG